MPGCYGLKLRILTGSITVMLMLAVSPLVSAQSTSLPSAPRPSIHRGVQRFEVGVETADMATGCGFSACQLPSFGVGAEGVWNWKPYLAFEADYLTTPNSSRGSTNLDGGRSIELLAGARAELRARHYGYFLLAEPGVFEWTDVIKGVISKPKSFSFTFGHQRRFVTNLGTGFEYSPSSRVHVRMEVGDLLMHYPGPDWQNNLQSQAGIYYGFGKSLTWTPPAVRADSRRTFFDRTNIALITMSALASIADGVTTQHFLKDGYSEGDPFARPLVKYGWAGQSAATAIEIGGETAGMYGLHRIGHRWLARMVPVAVTIVHVVFAYKNTELPAQPAQPVP